MSSKERWVACKFNAFTVKLYLQILSGNIPISAAQLSVKLLKQYQQYIKIIAK